MFFKCSSANVFDVRTNSQLVEEFLRLNEDTFSRKHPVYVAHSHVTSNHYGQLRLVSQRASTRIKGTQNPSLTKAASSLPTVSRSTCIPYLPAPRASQNLNLLAGRITLALMRQRDKFRAGQLKLIIPVGVIGAPAGDRG